MVLCPVCGKESNVVKPEYGRNSITYNLDCGHQKILQSSAVIRLEDAVGASDEVEILSKLQPGEVLVEPALQNGQPVVKVSGKGVNVSGSGLVIRVGEQLGSHPNVTNIAVFHNVANVVYSTSNTAIQTISNKLSQGNTLREFGDLIIELKNVLPLLQLPSEKVSEVKADITTVEAQLSSSKPKHQVIAECANTLVSVLSAFGATAPYAMKIAALFGLPT